MPDPLIVKICGIKSSAILEAAIEAGADIVGFMHFVRSPRHVDIEALQLLISEARGRVETCVRVLGVGPLQRGSIEQFNWFNEIERVTASAECVLRLLPTLWSIVSWKRCFLK